MRFLPALAAALLPLASVAQTDEWVRDDMSDESLWLLRTSNLAREAPRAGTLPGAPDSDSHWVMSKGDGPAYVVYFIPGRIHEVEIDTHRLAGASGDFTLAVSTDGKLYQPLDAGSVLLDTSFGWDYRLMASDQIPENATHLLVRFPDGSTEHSLSEVWIRYTWDDALVSRFLPAPAAAPPAGSELSNQSDAELQMMLAQMTARPQSQSAPQIEPPMELAQQPAPGISVSAPAPTPPAVDPAGETVPQPTAVPVEEPKLEVVGEVRPAIAAATTAPIEVAETEKPEEPIELAASLLEAASPAISLPGTEPVENPATDPEGAPPQVVEAPSEATPPKGDAPAEIAESQNAPEPDSAPAPAQEPDVIPPPEVESTPVDVALLEKPEQAAPAVAPELENAQEVVVLPTFTLPVLVTSKESETFAPAQLEPAPPAQELVVVATVSDPVASPAAAPPEAAASEPEQPTTIFEEPPATVSEAPPPAAIPNPDRTSNVAHVEPVNNVPAESLANDEESQRKPALKLKRTGPRSKSRGSYVTRG